MNTCDCSMPAIIEFLRPCVERLKITGGKRNKIQAPECITQIYGTLGDFCQKFGDLLASDLPVGEIEKRISRQIEEDCARHNEQFLDNLARLPPFQTSATFMTVEVKEALDIRRASCRQNNRQRTMLSGEKLSIAA